MAVGKKDGKARRSLTGRLAHALTRLVPDHAASALADRKRNLSRTYWYKRTAGLFDPPERIWWEKHLQRHSQAAFTWLFDENRWTKPYCLSTEEEVRTYFNSLNDTELQSKLAEVESVIERCEAAWIEIKRVRRDDFEVRRRDSQFLLDQATSASEINVHLGKLDLPGCLGSHYLSEFDRLEETYTRWAQLPPGYCHYCKDHFPGGRCSCEPPYEVLDGNIDLSELAGGLARPIAWTVPDEYRRVSLFCEASKHFENGNFQAVGALLVNVVRDAFRKNELPEHRGLILSGARDLLKLVFAIPRERSFEVPYSEVVAASWEGNWLHFDSIQLLIFARVLGCKGNSGDARLDRFDHYISRAAIQQGRAIKHAIDEYSAVIKHQEDERQVVATPDATRSDECDQLQKTISRLTTERDQAVTELHSVAGERHQLRQDLQYAHFGKIQLEQQRDSLLSEVARLETTRLVSELVQRVSRYYEHHPPLSYGIVAYHPPAAYRTVAYRRRVRRGVESVTRLAYRVLSAATADGERQAKYERIQAIVEVNLLRSLLFDKYLQLEPFIAEEFSGERLDQFIKRHLRAGVRRYSKESVREAQALLDHLYGLAEAVGPRIAERFDPQESPDRTSTRYRDHREVQDVAEERCFNRMLDADDAEALLRWLPSLTEYSRLKRTSFDRLLNRPEPPAAFVPPVKVDPQTKLACEHETERQISNYNVNAENMRVDESTRSQAIARIRRDVAKDFGIAVP